MRQGTLVVGLIGLGIGAALCGCASARQGDSPAGTGQARQTPDSAIDGMVLIKAGTYRMGADDTYPEEAPAHMVSVEAFWIDAHEVTNAQYTRFTDATGYVTVAERTPSAKDYPDADPSLLVAGSAVFRMPDRSEHVNEMEWWSYLPGANWRHPEGPESTIDDRMGHPVVHIAYEDAVAYASWCGKRLATEEEWEYAARGGLDSKRFAWGDELNPGGRFMANTWQGEFPVENTAADGFVRTAPAMRFPANGYGLYDMIGNVWEWTSTRTDAGEQIVKGGSFLCAPSYCHRYRPAAKSMVPPDTGTSHIGFRCVRSAEERGGAPRTH